MSKPKKPEFDRQIALIVLAMKRTGNSALQDVIDTLCQLKLIDAALHQEEPDIERVTQLLEELFMGSS
jgi:hypothetical protein